MKSTQITFEYSSISFDGSLHIGQDPLPSVSMDGRVWDGY